VKTHRNYFLRRVLPAAVLATLVAGAPVAWSQSTDATTPAAQNRSAERQAHFRQHLQRRLNRMAERLQITPAQEAAWTAYVNSIQSMVGSKLMRPTPEADAASFARFRADLAAERAQKFAQLADATAALQLVLNPEQQQTLSKIVREAGRRYHRRGHRDLS